jgi:hypothetical protein
MVVKLVKRVVRQLSDQNLKHFYTFSQCSGPQSTSAQVVHKVDTGNEISCKTLLMS